jgi:hypothetical protein
MAAAAPSPQALVMAAAAPSRQGHQMSDPCTSTNVSAGLCQNIPAVCGAVLSPPVECASMRGTDPYNTIGTSNSYSNVTGASIPRDAQSSKVHGKVSRKMSKAAIMQENHRNFIEKLKAITFEGAEVGNLNPKAEYLEHNFGTNLRQKFRCWICPGGKQYGASTVKLRRKNKDGSTILGLEGLVMQSFCRHLCIRRCKKATQNVLNSKLHTKAVAFLHKLHNKEPRMYQAMQIEAAEKAAAINKSNLQIEVDLRLLLPLLTDAEVIRLLQQKVSDEVKNLVVSLAPTLFIAP